MWWCLLFFFIITALAVGYRWSKRRHNYWVEKGVKQGNPWLFFGDNWGIVLKKQSFSAMIQMVYNTAPDSRYCGCYQFYMPSFVVRDPDLIRDITVKDFDHFTDHRGFVPEDGDPIWTKNLFSLTGKKWRDMRATLSPAFTSSKMKNMFTLISQNGEQFARYFLKKNEDVITIEMKDTFTRFANDVIANTAFGVECDSLGDRNNEFYLMGKELTDTSGFKKNLKFFGYFLVPVLYKIFKIPLMESDIRDFFYRLVSSNIESREKNNIVRPDILNLLMEARKHSLKHEESQPSQDTGFATVEESEIGKNSKIGKMEITDEDIAAQAVIFFFGGFDTVSSLMCFMSHELAVNPDIQERLIQEVDETLKTCKGQLTYETLFKMKYMDMVVSESLRKWPSGVALDRICTKPYTVERRYPDEKPVHLKKGDHLWVPVFGIHRDPKYYTDPERFDPERFSDENKGSIQPYTYMPFGVGPRNCIGSRLALLEIKTVFFHILAHFQIVPVERTQIPLVVSRTQFNLTAENGFWLGLKRRKV